MINGYHGNFKTKMKAVYIFYILLAPSLITNGQIIERLENVKGEWVISNDITPVQARENAINQAKVEALRKAGVPEYVAEANLLYKTENQKQLKEVFESLTTVEIAGEITEFSIVKEEKKINEVGNWIYEVWINATVTIHKTTKDPGFNIDVSGVRESYLSPDNLTFEIKPWKNGFLTIFILSGIESGLIFPNNLEKQEKLEGGKIYKFPKSKALDYEVTSEKSVEVNYLLLLYTKQEIPFTSNQTQENILRFIAKINPSEKCLKTYSLLIKK